MTVQDDERERELVRLFNLSWDPAHQRGGVDATLALEVGGVQRTVDVEVKSTTGETVSTARDVGMEHIAKWRDKMFVIGFYTREAKRPELRRCLCLTPDDMEPWIASIERKIAVDFRIAERSSGLLRFDDLWAVCGRQDSYAIADAKAVLKQQWSALEYTEAADLIVGTGRRYSPAAMLAVLKRRARYIAERGATLNNPHITKAHLARFHGTGREVNQNWAARIREIASAWIIARAQPDR